MRESKQGTRLSRREVGGLVAAGAVLPMLVAPQSLPQTTLQSVPPWV
jgi:hypothetical protein